MNTIAHSRTGVASDRFDSNPMRAARSLGTVALFFGVALLAGWFAVPLNRTAALDPAELTRRCAAWDAAALAAMDRRAEGPEIGRQVYLRSSMMWLAEARRSCDLGSDARAERFYERIVGRSVIKAAGAPVQAGAGR